MTRFSRLLLLLIACIGVSAVSPPCVYACSCAELPSSQVARDKATAVFVGKVITMQAATGEILSSGDPEQITFAVTQVWKGPGYTTLVVTTARESATCGFPFELNKDYLVYTTGSETALETSLCSRTRSLDDPTIQQDLDTLGQGKVPTSAPPASLLPSPIVSSTAVPIVTSPIAAPPTEPTTAIAIQSEGQSKSTLPLIQIMLITLVGIGLIIGIVVAMRQRK